MSNDVKNVDSSDINFSLNNFNGPLDLLLELIKKKNVDIFEVDLVEVATQYLKIIEDLQEKDIDIASEYLVMASELLYIKARLILALPEEEEEVQEDKNKILRLIAEYQEFKKISLDLKLQELKRKEVFIKKPSNTESFLKEIDESTLDGYGTTSKLIKTLRQMFERNYADKLRKIKLEIFNLSPSERREEIRKIIDQLNSNIIPFEKLFIVPSLNHFVITLIAVLDMARKEELLLEQNQQFDEIIIKKGVNY
ncbi:MAG: segregation/condensation protein A [Mycoplasmataceae bacterium]|nr:segregation/condensation protein A [Mycoplasmataceae bacterium]